MEIIIMNIIGVMEIISFIETSNQDYIEIKGILEHFEINKYRSSWKVWEINEIMGH